MSPNHNVSREESRSGLEPLTSLTWRLTARPNRLAIAWSFVSVRSVLTSIECSCLIVVLIVTYMYVYMCVCGRGMGGGGGAFKRMFSKIDAKPTLQRKRNLKHGLSFLDKYVNSRRPVPAKLLVQSIRLLKPEKHADTCSSSRVRQNKNDIDTGKDRQEEAISCMYTSS